MMTVNEKVKLLDMLKEGRSYASVARHYGVNESTVRYIKKDEVKICKTASISFNKEAKCVVIPRYIAVQVSRLHHIADFSKIFIK